MAHPKYDGVIEAVRYSPDGKVAVVRVYERRGPTFSDYVILRREELVQRLKAGQRYVTGKRLIYLASTFDVDKRVLLSGKPGFETLSTSSQSAGHDDLQGVPLF